ncbi:MAG: response regulator transcription factor [Omnitrophica WOR_2 bacterium]
MLTRVVLADDHPLIRVGIKSLFQKTPDVQIIGEAIDGVQALQLVKSLVPDVLILDIEMPKMTGIEVTQELMKIGSVIPILAYSAYDDYLFVTSVLECGAAGYLTKDEVPEMLLSAVRRIASGERGLVSTRIASILARLTQGQLPENLVIHPIL